MLFVGEMEDRILEYWDGRKEIQVVVVLKRRWCWWCGSNGEGRAVCEGVEVRRASDRLMTIMLVLEEDAMRLICGHFLQNGRSFEVFLLFER